MGLLFRALHAQLAPVAGALDVMIALGTHQPMSEAAICQRLEITAEQRSSTYKSVRFFNHEWDNPETFTHIGTITADQISQIVAFLESLK